MPVILKILYVKSMHYLYYLMLQQTEMEGPHSSQRAAEKDKIKEMLSDAIRILCQNTVSHHTKLSVEALIGITIDDGEDSIIVSISESVNASEAAYQREDQYQNTEADVGYADYDLRETAASNVVQYNDSISYGQQYNPSLPYQAVVKKETSVIRYNVGEYDTFQPSNVTSNHTADQYFAADGYKTANYGHQGAFNVQRKVTNSGLRRGRGRGQGVQHAPRQKTSFRSVPTVKPELGAEVDTTTGGTGKCSVETSEVSHVTLYTCQRCGKQMNNHSSFLRHKKSHLGIVYRCDGCGKILSRGDHLTAHRRHCPAALQQAPLDI